ncbi:UNVERIFIED_CONTAM: hypothetical protein RMT77_002779 [Armadillidium vulgare]
MSGHLQPFPVSRDDIAESFAATINPPDRRQSFDVCPSPKRPPRGGSNPSTAPGSARTTPPPAGKSLTGSPGFLTPSSMSPSIGSSRSQSLAAPEFDSRRSSMSKMATDAVKDFRKGVRNVTDTTKKATHKVKDKTAGMGTHVMVATVGASKWVANHTSKKAKAAMDQARSKLSIGEKITLYMFEKISVLSKKGFTHVFMFAIFIAYTALGALLFIACEAPHEEAEKLLMTEERLLLTKELWNKKSTSTDYERFTEEVKELLGPYEDQLYRSFKVGVSVDSKDWTFWKAMFFCSTITTTIGYGHITPKTTAGRALTIVYAIIGIPIFLILMADFGKLFTRLLKNIFLFIRRVYKSGTCVKARKHPTVQKWRNTIIMAAPSLSSFGSNSESIATATTGTDVSKTELDHISEGASSDDESLPRELEEFRQRVQEAKSIHRQLSVTELHKCHSEKLKLPQSHSVPQNLINVHHQLEMVTEEPTEETEISPKKEKIPEEHNEIKKVKTDDNSIFQIIKISDVDNGNPIKEENNDSTTGFSCWSFTGIHSRASGRLTSLKNIFFCGGCSKSDDSEKPEGKESKDESRNSVEGDEEYVVEGEGDDKYFSDGNFNLPISLALFILILYMIIGCIIYISWEEWFFFDAFYFIFISMTTIGFGDFVPEHPAFMMATALYLVFGLALTAMCINIIQEKLTNTFREASTKLKVSFSKIMESSQMTGDCIEGPVIEGPVLDKSDNDDSGYNPNPATSIRL